MLMKTPGTVGDRLRRARHGKQWSLKQVADKAAISAATLSRIETSKQAVDLTLFLLLAQILGKDPSDLLAETADGNGRDRLISGISDLDHADKLRIWTTLATATRSKESVARRSSAEVRQVAMQVEELLACIEYVQSELAEIQKKLNR